MSAAAGSRPAAWEAAPSPVREQRAPRLVDYVLLRLTGVLLSVLVLGHFVVTHFVTDVARDDSAFVARRLSSAVWIAWDSAMLAAAVAHGSVGLRIAIADYATPARRRVLERVVLALGTLVFTVGAAAIARAAGA
jgi:succinate dehydrogenase / fumarate reductase membrane anchor subunit